MRETLKTIHDWVARNRRWFGGLGLAVWTVAQGDAQLIQQHPRMMMYGGAVAAYVFASGIHKPDSDVKAKQEREG